MVSEAMMKLSYIRSGLLASSLLLTTALSATAFANDDRDLPNLSPSEISRDVVREFNNRTGAEEFIAPTFDPFEQDSSMAGAVSLRSVGAPVTTIDGEVLSNGAMLDMNFYYNSPGDDPYDVRGFTDVAFLSGSLAPAVRRNNRILECSRNVEKVVYDHRYYTSPLFVSIGLNRGFRRYSGHRGYGRFDRPYWRNRGYGGFGHGVSTGRSWGRTTYPRGYRANDRDHNRNDRVLNNHDRDDVRDRDRTDRNRNDRDRTQDRRASSSIPAVRMDRNGRMSGTVSRGNERATNNDRTRRNDGNNSGNRAVVRTRNNDHAVNTDRSNRSNSANRTRSVETRNRTIPSNTSRNNTSRDNSARGSNQNRTNQNRSERREISSETRNNRARVTLPVSSTTERATRRSSSSDRKNQSRQQSALQQRSAPKANSSDSRSNNTVKRSAPKRSAPKSRNRSEARSILNFFPGSSSYGRDVVQNVSVDCAREEILSVFIPAQRLDAARFDGLTVLALDNRGQEYPVFIPPNYIEGFKQAIGGNYVRHNGTAVPSIYTPRTQTNDPYSTSPYREEIRPQVRLEAVCPSGTTKQSDGTCLLVNGSYPR